MKKQTMKNIAYVAAGTVLSLASIGIYTTFMAAPTDANPDYICVKDVSRSCQITNDESLCTPWASDGTRVCPWTRTLKVAYYLRRTTCEQGYTRVSRGTNSWGSGWRQSSDFDYQTEACTITQVDREVPIWTTE